MSELGGLLVMLVIISPSLFLAWHAWQAGRDIDGGW